MKVENVVGWYDGRDGRGNVFEVSTNGELILATIWGDGKFHRMLLSDILKQRGLQKAHLDWDEKRYAKDSSSFREVNGTLEVDNPAGWNRFYAAPAPGTETPGGETEDPVTTTEDELVFPFSFSFTGTMKINVGGISKLLKFIE
jgi:hypothetical protein